MIKKIIFDLDNTLIEWKEEYNNSIIKAFKQFNIEITKNEYNEFDRVLRLYEKQSIKFNIDEMEKFFSQNCKVSIPEGYVAEWFKNLEYCVPENNNNLKEVLEYLSKKYQLVVLTNWFTVPQTSRLKKAGVLKYFDEVIGADIIGLKPSENVFNYAKGTNSFEECLMIGDNVEIDLEIPRKLGMETILITNKNINYENKISKLEELKQLL